MKQKGRTEVPTGRQVLGKYGEEIAERYLVSQGYRILRRNWRWKRLEMDLIAQIDDTIVFIEVKCRRSARWGPPEQAVDWRKEQQLARLAAAFLSGLSHSRSASQQVRFDILSVLVSGEHAKLRHIRDAFFPGI